MVFNQTNNEEEGIPKEIRNLFPKAPSATRFRERVSREIKERVSREIKERELRKGSIAERPEKIEAPFYVSEKEFLNYLSMKYPELIKVARYAHRIAQFAKLSEGLLFFFISYTAFRIENPNKFLYYNQLTEYYHRAIGYDKTQITRFIRFLRDELKFLTSKDVKVAGRLITLYDVTQKGRDVYDALLGLAMILQQRGVRLEELPPEFKQPLH